MIWYYWLAVAVLIIAIAVYLWRRSVAPPPVIAETHPVLRGSGTPTDYTGLVAWHKADAIVGLSDGQDITSWPDSGANGYNATQHGTNGLPTYKTNVKNGLPVARFVSAESDTLVLLSTGALDAWRNKGYGAVFVVFSPASATVKGDVVFIETGTGVGRVGLAVSETGYTGEFTLFGRRLDADTVQYIHGGTVVAGDWYIATILFEWANAIAHVRLNGQPLVESHSFQTAGNTSDTRSYHVAIASSAGASYMQGDVGEVIWYNGQITEAQAAEIEAYLNNRWAVYASARTVKRHHHYTNIPRRYT